MRHTGSLVVYPPRAPVEGANPGTMVAQLTVGATGPLDFRSLFLGAWTGIRRIARSRDEVGVALFAIDRHSGELASSLAISGRPGRVLGATVGRHDEADLRLVGDAWLANRQLAVLVHPLTSWEPDRLRYSVLDLRTHRPMVGESGAALASVVVEGPFFARVGRHALFALPTGEASDFPERAVDAWDILPERVLLARRAPTHDAALHHQARNLALDAIAAAQPERPVRTRQSVITSIGPLVRPDERLRRADEPVVGELTLRTADARLTYSVGASALDRGILLGRYPRCDGAGILALDRISRAHLLIKRVDGQLVALDTGSTNGTVVLEPRLLAGPVRVTPLAARTLLRLAEVADVEWAS